MPVFCRKFAKSVYKKQAQWVYLSIKNCCRSRSYEHIDEPDLSDGSEEGTEGTVPPPLIVNDEDIIQIDEILAKRRKSTSERRQAVIIGHDSNRQSLS